MRERLSRSDLIALQEETPVESVKRGRKRHGEYIPHAHGIIDSWTGEVYPSVEIADDISHQNFLKSFKEYKRMHPEEKFKGFQPVGKGAPHRPEKRILAKFRLKKGTSVGTQRRAVEIASSVAGSASWRGQTISVPLDSKWDVKEAFEWEHIPVVRIHDGYGY